jgi:hypothetical protein
MCHTDQQWTEELPLVLLRIRTAFKQDLQSSIFELVYGEPLRTTGELLAPAAKAVDTVHLITELRQHMAHLRPVPTARHTSPPTSVHDLEKYTHVFIRRDTTRRALGPPFSGHYLVLSRREKTIQLLVRGRHVTVSIDRVKLAYILNGNDHGIYTFNTTVDATPAVTHPATQTTRSGGHIHSPHVLKFRQPSPPRRGDVGTDHNSNR